MREPIIKRVGMAIRNREMPLRPWSLVTCALAMSAFGCVSAPEEPVSAARSAVTGSERAASQVRLNDLPADFTRARLADEAARRFDAEHPSVPVVPPTAVPQVDPSRSPGGGIPDERFLTDPDLTVGSGLLVADVSFLSSGEPDDYALEPTGRYRVSTMRYRVRANGVVRSPGLPIPEGEFDLFAPRGFVPSGGSAEGARMLVVLGDHSLRPGFNVKVATPLSAVGGLTGPALGAPGGATAGDLIRGLRTRAVRFAAERGGA